MLKQNWKLIARIEWICDNAIVIAAFFVAYFGRSSLLYWDQAFSLELPFGGEIMAPLSQYAIVLLVAVPLYNVLLRAMGAYSSMRFSSPWRLLKITSFTSLLAFFGIAAALFILKIDLSRMFVILFCAFNALALSAQRFVVLNLLRFWRRRGKNFRNIIIVGVGKQARRLAHEIVRRPELGVRLVGFAKLNENDAVPSRLPSQVFFSVAEVESILKDQAVDEVIFTDVLSCMAEVEELIIICSEEGVRTTLAADLFSIGMVRSEVSYFAGFPLIHYQTPPGDGWELVIKRLIDVVVASILLLLLAPFLLLIALIVKLTSAGPVLFCQQRVGLNGRLFDLYKFRSMFDGADLQRASLDEQNEMQGPAFKISHDPRVSTFGKFLRRFSLDELPQLWNVLRGDMSLVGPRPPIPDEVHKYVRRYRRRLSMRPGLTCTWQVSGRNEICDFESWVKLDLDYIDNWSLGQDALILVRTIPAVLFGVGAK